MVRNQRCVSVETLVRILFPDDTLNTWRKLDRLDMRSLEADRRHDIPQVSKE